MDERRPAIRNSTPSLLGLPPPSILPAWAAGRSTNLSDESSEDETDDTPDFLKELQQDLYGNAPYSPQRSPLTPRSIPQQSNPTLAGSTQQNRNRKARLRKKKRDKAATKSDPEYAKIFAKRAEKALRLKETAEKKVLQLENHYSTRSLFKIV